MSANGISYENLNPVWVRSMKENIQNGRIRRWRTEHCTIFKAPSNYRNDDVTAYEPRIISLGPFHSGDDRFKEMEKIKWRYLGKFLSLNQNMQPEDYLRKMKEWELRARSCYSDDYKMDSDKFAETMLLDGCFIVELLLKQLRSRAEDQALMVDQEEDQVVKSVWMLPIIQFDMIKMENQIPFFILQYLFDCIPNNGGRTLSWLALRLFSQALRFDMNDMNNTRSEQCSHFLHLVHAQLIPFSPANNGDDYTESIPCATKLEEAGVRFRKKEINRSSSFLDVSFKNGVLEMAPIHLYDQTFSLLRNLIAFEQCYPDAGTHVACYAFFMDCLVDTAGDVALLQSKGIIVNGLGSDLEAALLFNRICKEVAFDHTKSYLAGMFREIEEYSNSRIPKWRAKLMHDYFNSPWSLISVAAAVVLLVLTALQTIYSILSYKKSN